MKHGILPILVTSLLVAVSGEAMAQCGSTVQGTNGNPLPLVIGTEADCVANSRPIPATSSSTGQSNVTPLGCGASQQRDIWFVFTANTDETLISLYDNNVVDIGFMVYGEPCANTMDLVACVGYGQPASYTTIRAIVPTVPGTRYYVRVSRRNSNTLATGLRICGWDFGRIPDHPVCDGNASFENGTTAGWTCRYGNYGVPAPVRLRFPETGCLNPQGNDAPLSPGNGNNTAWNAGDRHVLIGDKRFLDPRTRYNLTGVAPGGGHYSFRLGDNDYGCGVAGTIPCPTKASAMSLDLAVTPWNVGFTLMFAVVMYGPPYPRAYEDPRFDVLVTTADGDTVECASFLVTPRSGFAEFKLGSSIWRYTEWTEFGLDLLPYIGRTISIAIRVGNSYPAGRNLACPCSASLCTYTTDDDEGQWYRCTGPSCSGGPNTPGFSCEPIDAIGSSAGSDAAYAYIDTYCRPLGPNGQDWLDGIEFCRNADSIVICAPRGYRDYSWPAGQPGTTGPLDERCVTILNPVDGQGYTAYMEMLTGCAVTRTAALRLDPDCTVGIEEVAPPAALELFPNPTGDRLTIKLHPNVRVELFRVMDAQGRVVMERMGGPQRELELGILAPGVYSVRVETDRGAMTGRFVKE